MRKVDEINVQVWKAILQEIKSLRQCGVTQELIAQRLGVKRSTVSRWLDNSRGGEKNTVGQVVHCMRSLDIPPNILFPELIESNEFILSPLDKKIAQTLKKAADVLGVTPSDLAESATPVLATETVHRMLEGKIVIPSAYFAMFCKRIGVTTDAIINRSLAV